MGHAWLGLGTLYIQIARRTVQRVRDPAQEIGIAHHVTKRA